MVEVGTIFDIKKFAIHDGPGIRTTVFLWGCPLDCWWCHNPESRSLSVEGEQQDPCGAASASQVAGRRTVNRCSVTVETVVEEIIKDEIFYDQSGGGVTFSGGEPMMQMEFLTSLLQECRGRGIHTAVDTCGHAPEEAFDEIYDLVDLFLFDLKLMDEQEHIRYTGVSNRMIHQNLIALASRGEKVVVRIPMIPDVTDTSENLDAVAAFLKTLTNIRRIGLLPYNPLGEDKSERYRLSRPRHRWQPQATEEMSRKAGWFESLGYEVRVGG